MLIKVFFGLQEPGNVDHVSVKVLTLPDIQYIQVSCGITIFCLLNALRKSEMFTGTLVGKLSEQCFSLTVLQF